MDQVAIRIAKQHKTCIYERRAHLWFIPSECLTEKWRVPFTRWVPIHAFLSEREKESYLTDYLWVNRNARLVHRSILIWNIMTRVGRGGGFCKYKHSSGTTVWRGQKKPVLQTSSNSWVPLCRVESFVRINRAIKYV